MLWRVSATKAIDLSTPCVMAILNVTPDSFSDGGMLDTPAAAARAAEAAVRAGAKVLDIGGESTRPGAEPVTPDQQLQRVVPAIIAIRSHPGLRGAPITVDTTSAEVAETALCAGADGINDISAGRDDSRMLEVAARHACGIVLMHRLAPARADRYSDQYERAPVYTDVVAEVGAFLRERADAAISAGVARSGIVIDPGLGFGKTVEQNLELIRGTARLAALGFPVLSGLSRKSFTGRVSLGRDSHPGERLPGTIALSVLHYRAGARIFRVHDVPDHVAALHAAAAITGCL
jgi:dihydropteroate synthase